MAVNALLVFGTRPEAIKMAPLVRSCLNHPDVTPTVCVTGQHREMLAQVMDYFELTADVDLELMRPNQTLAGLTARCLEGLDTILAQQAFDCVVVQGDTATVMAASLAAFFRKVPVVHVEAGLRTGNLHSPWPEELNRRVTSLTTEIHCAPTARAAQHLRDEGYAAETIHVTGNTVIDALLWAVDKVRDAPPAAFEKYAEVTGDRMVLVTGHRRENFGGGFVAICRALDRLAQAFPETQFVYPLHLNPNVRGPVQDALGNHSNIHLLPPAPYAEFVYLMDQCTLILTDSGGVQEEAPSLKKPVLVMRDTTERPEAVDAGAVELVGTDEDQIVARATALLNDPQEYARHQIKTNPYGDGQAAQRIVDLIVNRWN